MRKRIRKIVVFGRYTPFVGSTAIYSSPLDMRAYSGAVSTAWQGTGLGLTPATVEFSMEVSPDLENWTETDVLSPSAGMEESAEVAFDYPWMRWKAEVSGSDAGVTGWLVMDLIPREIAPGGGGA